MTAAPPTQAVIPAAADEESVRIAHLFSQHARDYQALAGKAAASQHHFVQNLKASAASYASAEAANTALLQPLTATADSIAAGACEASRHGSDPVVPGEPFIGAGGPAPAPALPGAPAKVFAG